MKRLRWLALCWLAWSAGSALAADRSVSYSTWVVSGNLVTMRLVLPVSEARRLVGVAVPVLTTDRLKDYVLEHVTVSSAGGDCPAIDQGYDLGKVDPLAVGPGLYGFELLYRCADPRQMVLRNTVLFAAASDHLNFAHIRTHGQVVEQFFTAARQQLALPDSGAPPAAAFSAYLRVGVRHALGSPECWCVLLGALLLMRGWRDVAAIMVALAAGYLVSLGLSASGWVVPRVSAVEAFVGLLIALLGGVLVLREAPYRMVGIVGWAGLLLLLALAAPFMHTAWAVPLLLGGACVFAGVMRVAEPSAGVYWWVLVGLFALLDGVSVAAVLPPAQLPQRSLLQVLLGFDGGAWLIESVILAASAGVLLLKRAQRMVGLRTVLDELAAASLSGVGTFWLVSRLWA